MDVGSLVNDQYKVIEHIGRGGMADVWSARDTRLRRMVAIKTIVAGLSKDVDPVELFKREAHTIAQMEHPHILPIYDFGDFENNLYIVMRYVTGGSLEDMLRDGPMSPEDVLRMGENIGSALDYAHSNNVIHLDLKPPNILLDSSGAPYLADFGLATVLDPEGRARNPGSGTLLYMAPEQMVAETIDHRADIYSFSIMLFHMLTGNLPFDGSIPLSISQVQRDQDLPNVSDYVPHIPDALSDLLRLGTHKNPDYRPQTHDAVMDEFRSILQPSGYSLISGEISEDYVEADPYNMLTEPYDGDIEDAGLLEAVDIYSRARYDWQGGQGRFLLGVTNFILISEYYQNASMYNLTIDRAGYQVLLRGAIEYDYELDYWWNKVNDDERRWVCLHALRSGNTPARIRALYRLETLPDEEGTAVIPRLVAQALEVETDDNAKLAALKVLGTRARLMKERPNLAIMTEYRGRLISSMTRLGIELRPPSTWQDVVYSDDVDTLVAEQAFDLSPEVAEFAARTVGRMRSLVAVEHLSREQQIQRSGALQALAFVRDEAPSLPDVVKRDARFYAWITNTVRRLTEHPLDLIASLTIVFALGWIAMGNHVWNIFRFTVGSLSPQRMTNTVGLGVIFGLMLAITYLFTVVTAKRLQGFWSWWLRLLVSGGFGFAIGTVFFASYRFFLLQDIARDIPFGLMRFAGAGLAFGMVATSLLRLRAWEGIVLTTVTTFAPIYVSHAARHFPEQTTIIPLALIALLVGIYCGWRAAQRNEFVLDVPILKLRFMPWIAGISVGVIWTVLTWLFLFLLWDGLKNGQSFSWNMPLYIMTVTILIGMIISYWSNNRMRLSLTVAAVISFAVAYALFSWQFFDYQFSVPLASPAFEVLYYDGVPLEPTRTVPIIRYDDDRLHQVFTLTLPFVVVIAMAVNSRSLLGEWWSWIGDARTPKDRGAWLTIVLGYVMIASAFLSLVAMFAPVYEPVPLYVAKLLWGLWMAVNFVLALAAFRWAKWGANGLIISSLLLIVAGIAYDGINMYLQAQQGMFPALLSPVPQIGELLQPLRIDLALREHHFWGIWSVLLAVFIWGAQRRLLWGGIGLVTMVVSWLILWLATPLTGSVSVFVVANVALLLYVLQFKYDLMEAARWQAPQPSDAPEPVKSTTPERTQDLRTTIEMAAVPATEILAGLDVMDGSDPMATRTPGTDSPHFAETLEHEAISDDDLDTESQVTPQQKSTLTDMKVNLDTSALNKQQSSDDTEDAPRPKGLSDIKVTLDTSKLSKPKKESDTPETPKTESETSPPKPIFRFDTSNITNKNTVKFEEQTDDGTEIEDDTDETEDSSNR